MNRILTTLTLLLLASPASAALSSSDSAALATADANIAKYRTATATIGGFQPGQSVAVNMTRNAFNFGVGAGSDQLQNKTASALILANANSITPRGGGYPMDMESTKGRIDFGAIDLFNDFATKNKLSTRFHTLAYNTEEGQPSWLNSLQKKAMGGDSNAKKQLVTWLQGRVNYVLNDTHQHYTQMDVFNESSSVTDWVKAIGYSNVASIYNQIHVKMPSLQAGVNNDHLFNGRFTTAYLNDVKEIQAAGGYVGELGMEDYLGWSGEALPTPSSIASNLAKLNALGLPSVLTELGGFSGLKNTDVLMNQTLRMMYGNPLTTGVYDWTWVNTGSSQDWAPTMALYNLSNGRYTQTPAGAAWQAFIKSVMTNLTAKADANGFVSFTGYLGDYSIGGKAFTLTKSTGLSIKAVPEPRTWILALIALLAYIGLNSMIGRMLKRRCRVVLALLCLLPTVARAETPLSSTEQTMVTRINAERAAYAKPALVVDPCLMQCARHRVQWYDHFAEGCGVEASAHRFGFKGTATDDLAQDDGSGAWSVGEMVHGWVLSFGHRQQLLGKINLNNRWVEMNFDRVGVAHRGRNWIAVFGREDAK
jgi:GH35 family endo-1,4-beta-xylanase/uncharacterized protein YkwD